MTEKKVEKKKDKVTYAIWVKPDKTEIKLNNEKATVAQATELGWKPKSSK